MAPRLAVVAVDTPTGLRDVTTTPATAARTTPVTASAPTATRPGLRTGPGDPDVVPASSSRAAQASTTQDTWAIAMTGRAPGPEISKVSCEDLAARSP
ncbi:hypothetical protein ATO49_24725 [Mycolicibacterium fortuitum subsp. fortuitum DSM 46621 = ATCC 6841 = JCM 6387]|nr:hypothetical protein ATO49_24725 [Mycolicibacterium fortuitum subsp. fortuitum DSM 46621 = ATCC 6841 = JCM 6387]